MIEDCFKIVYFRMPGTTPLLYIWKHNLFYLDIRSGWISEVNVPELYVPHHFIWFLTSLRATINLGNLFTKYN